MTRTEVGLMCDDICNGDFDSFLFHYYYVMHRFMAAAVTSGQQRVIRFLAKRGVSVHDYQLQQVSKYTHSDEYDSTPMSLNCLLI